MEMIPAALALLLPVFLVFVIKHFRYKERCLMQAPQRWRTAASDGAVPGADKRLAA